MASRTCIRYMNTIQASSIWVQCTICHFDPIQRGGWGGPATHSRRISISAQLADFRRQNRLTPAAKCLFSCKFRILCSPDRTCCLSRTPQNISLDSHTGCCKSELKSGCMYQTNAILVWCIFIVYIPPCAITFSKSNYYLKLAVYNFHCRII